jgi:hypothetical protein
MTHEERKQWFIDRIGNVVYRTKTTCGCGVCEDIYKKGLLIADEMHARYIHDCEFEQVAKYFDTIEERDEYERQR